MMLLVYAMAHAWITTSQEQDDVSAETLDVIRASNGAVNRVWSLPEDTTNSKGLGGGLTFAYDEKICDELLPAMSEASGLWGLSFVDCSSISAAIRSAFASWTVNHPNIKFHDVTNDCRLQQNEKGGPFGKGCSLYAPPPGPELPESSSPAPVQVCTAADQTCPWLCRVCSGRRYI